MMLDKHYNPAELEKKWYDLWESAGYFAPTGQGTPYCIMIPPPNVTGSLHMGHAFQQTLMDILIRYHRMKGNNTLWQVGTDHAGIATQMVVERQLMAEGKHRTALGREAFNQRVWQWKAESGGNITRQLRRIGASVDWSSERFTLDAEFSHAVLKTFVQLFKEGLIYRGKRLVNWDPVLKTAVSDLEVESEEENGSLWHIRYPLADDVTSIVVATTRPETLLGDVAVAVHPEDKRFAHLIGRLLKLPLTERLIPIIADDAVDPTFGTGCVKITPAHDFNDYAMGKRHQLEPINIFTPEATLNDCAPPAYQGLDRMVARQKIIEDLKSLNLLEKIEPHVLKVPRGDKSGAILEPLLTDQWFVKTAPLASAAIAAVEQGKIRFVPDNWSKTYFDWMHNIQDWCISRQLWWGHRIPAWYDAQGNVYVGMDEASVRKEYQLADAIPLTQDEDVLDTWFSAALWPSATLGWPENTERYRTFYPTQVLVTGFDIIFFWVARMVMFGLKFTEQIPFQTVYIHGLIQDENGQKMSKTKGNVLDPIDIIDGIDLETLVKKRISGMMQPQLAEAIERTTRAQFPSGIPAFGTDPLRFTFAALASSRRHIRFDFARVKGYKHFCNKLWNAARYILLNIKPFNRQSQPLTPSAAFKMPSTVTSENAHSPDRMINRWILSIWQTTKATVEQHLQTYRFDLAAQTLYDFTWHEYCDWYLELSKPLLNAPDPNPEIGSAMAPNAISMFETSNTLVTVFEELLRVIHPFMPYITEAIWQSITPLQANQTNSPTHSKTIMLQPYPECITDLIDQSAEQEIQWLKDVIVAVRKIRGEMNKSPATRVDLLVSQGSQDREGYEKDRARLKNYESLLKTLAKLERITGATHGEMGIKHSEANIPYSRLGAPTFVHNLKFTMGIRITDKALEISRLQKEIEKVDKAIDKSTKLLTDGFIKNAPAARVRQAQDDLANHQRLRDNLYACLAELQR